MICIIPEQVSITDNLKLLPGAYEDEKDSGIGSSYVLEPPKLNQFNEE